MHRTKIICTIGPASDNKDCIQAMIRAGMNVVRINFSHGDHKSHVKTIEMIHSVAESASVVLPIIGDLQGPKIRVGKIEGGQTELVNGDEVVLTFRDVSGNSKEIHLPHIDLIEDIEPEQKLLIDDGKLELLVFDKNSEDLFCRVVNGGILGSNKGVSVPGAKLSIPALTEKDRQDAQFAVEHNLDFLALSFVRSGRDVLQLRDHLASMNSSIPIIVKIEKPEALTQFDEILTLSQGVMIARGDLGVEIPPEHVPFTQKKLITKCKEAAVPVITATQMLDSMIDNHRPTRAEASDVANAILDGTSAVMLSGETASGKFPVQSVQMMARIAEFSEKNIPYDDWIYSKNRFKSRDTAEAISEATVEIAHELNAKAIVTSSYSGLTARLVARHRSRTPIIAITPNSEVHRQMELLWGVTSKLVPFYNNTDGMIEQATRAVLECGVAGVGDTIVITAGVPPGAGQQTNMINVYKIPG